MMVRVSARFDVGEFWVVEVMLSRRQVVCCVSTLCVPIVCVDVYMYIYIYMSVQTRPRGRGLRCGWFIISRNKQYDQRRP